MADTTPFESAVDDLEAGAGSDPAARRRAPGALEIRRRVEHLFHHELAEPSEELLCFVRSRLDLDEGGRPSEETRELCRRALRDMGRDRWRDPAPAAGRLSSDRRQIDRRRFELHRELPGYYLG